MLRSIASPLASLAAARRLSRALLSAGWLLILLASAPAAASDDEASELPWWNDAVFYEVFVRSFYDSNGDGVGDLNGLIEKLDYLNDGDPGTDTDLGVTGLWLMPVTESPSYHGYDVVDYRHIDREYGTNEDFQRLMEEAHRRGIRIIVDLVMNHTSSKHEWFEASSSGADDPHRRWYIWRPDHPGWKGPWGAPAWHKDPSGYYYGVFWGGMPDLNFWNANVTNEMRDITRFWLEDLGADGFRLDAIKHLLEEGPVQENTTSTQAWLRHHYQYVESIAPEALMVGEIWSGTKDIVPYIGTGVDLAFEFSMANAMLRSARFERAKPALEALREVTAEYPPHQWASFLANHDQERAMQFVLDDPNRARTAASLLLTAPGVPFLYYGEEVGQTGKKPDENLRTPMQWSREDHAGFTTGKPWRGPQKNWKKVNVAAQTGDPGSLLSHYRRLIHLRNAHPALRRGDWIEVESSHPEVYACLRTCAEETLLVLVNLGGTSRSDYELSLATSPTRGGEVRPLFSERPAAAPAVDGAGGFRGYRPFALDGYETAILQLGAN